MWQSLILTSSLVLGQTGYPQPVYQGAVPVYPAARQAYPGAAPAYAAPAHGRPVVIHVSQQNGPAIMPPANGTADSAAPMIMPPHQAPANGNGANGGNGSNGCEEKKEEEGKKEPEKYLLMKALEGTPCGCALDAKRLQVLGWLAGSYTASSAAQNNAPVVWNDRANEFLLQQAWLRLERSVVTEDAKEATFGFRMDLMYGTDYRFTLPRGLFNSQLENADGAQNLYGFDPIQFYVNGYFPNIFKGTEVRVGRHYTPFGVESLEAVSTPLISRSYAFNFCPPFTHTGILSISTFSDRLQGYGILANGNDVFIDRSQEMRFIGRLTYTSCDKKSTYNFGTSVGRGKFNAGDPNVVATAALANEPAGRNNINVFDFVYTRTLSDKVTYNFETIYGYQYGVPANVPGGLIKLDATHGTAHWGSIVNYLFYNFSEKTSGVLRVEVFDDFEGQRTGFEGLYTAVAGDLVFKPRTGVQFRTEVRYDYQNNALPFEGERDIFTAAAELILRY